MKKLPLTIILPAHNEEKNLAECLESVSFADEIIVVNGESFDGTRDIAVKAAVRIIDTPNAFAETQRLKAVRVASYPWVFLIDADERVTETLRKSIEAAIASPAPLAAYEVRRKNLFSGRAVHLHDPDWQMRLFRIEKTVFPDKIHRPPQVNGPTGRLEGDLLHYFFTGIRDYLKRLSEYTRAESSYQLVRPSGLRLAWMLFGRPPARFLQYYFLRKGFLDGYFGFFYSASSAYYEWVVASKWLVDQPASGDLRIK